MVSVSRVMIITQEEAYGYRLDSGLRQVRRKVKLGRCLRGNLKMVEEKSWTMKRGRNNFTENFLRVEVRKGKIRRET